MLLRVVLGRFLCVMVGMVPMPRSNLRMVCSRLMTARFVMLSGFSMVFCCELVMFRRIFVVLSAVVCCHIL